MLFIFLSGFKNSFYSIWKYLIHYVNFIYGNLLLENYDVYKIFIKGIIVDK